MQMFAKTCGRNTRDILGPKIQPKQIQLCAPNRVSINLDVARAMPWAMMASVSVDPLEGMCAKVITLRLD